VVGPDVAVFGAKDAQQFAVLKRMVKELDIPVRMISSPIIRERDGLALSSRNVYLSQEDRLNAPSLYKALLEVKHLFQQGRRDSKSVLKTASKIVKGKVQYFKAVHPDSLQQIKKLEKGTIVLAAMICGKTRLIDNIVL